MDETKRTREANSWNDSYRSDGVSEVKAQPSELDWP